MGDFENESSNENYDYDEIKQFLNTRYVSPPEAMYRLLKFPMYRLSHIICLLAVHLENEQFVYFKEGSERESINRNLNTTLTAWFELNASDQDARTYLYPEIANFYVFNKQLKKWTVRKKNYKSVFSRMYFVNSKDCERFYLRLLLLHVTGPQSFEDIRTFQNFIYPTFYKAAIARKLITSDEE